MKKFFMLGIDFSNEKLAKIFRHNIGFPLMYLCKNGFKALFRHNPRFRFDLKNTTFEKKNKVCFLYGSYGGCVFWFIQSCRKITNKQKRLQQFYEQPQKQNYVETFHYEEVRQHLQVNRVVIANLIDRYRNNNYYQAGELM